MTGQYGNRPQTGFETNLIEVANYLFSHKLLIMFAAVATVAIVGLWATFFSTPTYQAQSTVIYNFSSANPLDEQSTYWSQKAEVENKLYILSVFLNSDRFKIELAKEVLNANLDDSQSPYPRDAQIYIQRQLKLDNITRVNAAASYIGGLIDVTVQNEKNAIQISSRTPDPLLSQAIVNLGANTLVKMNYEVVLKELNSISKFIQSQVETTKAKLYDLEERLSEYQKQEKILSTADTGSGLDSLQMEIAKQINDLEVKKTASEIWISEIESTIADFKTNLNQGLDSPLYLVQLQNRLDLLLYQHTMFNKEAPRSIASENKVAVSDALKTTLDAFHKSLQNVQSSKVTTSPWKYLESLEEAISAARHKNSEIKTQLRALKKVNNTELQKYNTLPSVFRKINQMRREIVQTSELYQALNSKLQETMIRRAGISNDLEVLRFSQSPGYMIDMPLWQRYLLSFLGGAFVLVLLLTLRYILIPTIRSRNDLQKAGAEVIAEVPFVRLADTDSEASRQAPLLLRIDPTSDESNDIRQARFIIEEKFQLQHSRNEGQARTITVCSSNSKEGKTFVSSNLSYALSLAQFRVLLLDLDILNPSNNGYFGIEATSRDQPDSSLGIEEGFYFNRVPVNAFMDLVTIPRTDSNLSDLLETPLLGDYLGSMKKEYDVIVIDTPPIRNSLEALIASRYSDGMVFVANQRKSLRHDVFRALETIQENYRGRVFAILNFSYDELNSSRRRIAG